MSHYSVAVFTDGSKSVDELLAPFDENIEVEEYVVIKNCDVVDHIIEKMSACKDRIAEERLDDLKFLIDNKKILQEMLINSNVAYKSTELANQDDGVLVNVLPEYTRLCDIINCWCDGTFDKKTGNTVSTYNKQSKWDWYQIGGRFTGLLKASRGTYGERSWCNQDEGYREGYFDSAKVEDLELDDNFSTFAVLTPDGKWYEMGEMGWFGMYNKNENTDNWDKCYKEKFIDTADENWTLTIVDFHI